MSEYMTIHEYKKKYGLPCATTIRGWSRIVHNHCRVNGIEVRRTELNGTAFVCSYPVEVIEEVVRART